MSGRTGQTIKGLFKLSRPVSTLTGVLAVALGGYVAGTGAWWPVGLVAAVPGSPLRRPARRALAIVAAVAVCDAAIEARRSGSNAGAGIIATIAALAVADDMAYGAGVWWGCLGSRSLRSLLPRFERSAHRL